MFNIKKITLITFSSLLMFSPVLSIQADEYDDKIQAQTEKISTLENEQTAAENALSALETQISKTEAEVDDLFAKKTQEEERLNELNSEIADLKVAIEKRNHQLKEQARDVQVNQLNNSVVEAILTADSLNEAVGRAMAVTTLVNANNEIIEKQQVDQAKLEELSLEAQEKLATIEQQSQLLQEKQESLVEARLDQEVAINELQSMITTEKKQKATFEAQKEEAIRKREAQLKAIAAQKAKDEAARIAAAEQLAAQQEAAKTATKKVETQPAVSNTSVADVPNNNTTPTTETVTPPVQESSPVTSSGWGLPVSSVSVSSPYGWRANPWGNGPSDFHDGIDLVGASGTSIYASKAGTVATTGYDASGGNYVIINHGDGYYSYYLHLSSFAVSTGQSVGQGSLVGGMGTTGNSTGVHLHFGIATSGSWSGFVDPAPLLGI